MSKIYMKDIINICSCISGLSCQTVRNNKKGAFNKGYINKLNEFERLLNDRSAYNYTCIYSCSCFLL